MPCAINKTVPAKGMAPNAKLPPHRSGFIFVANSQCFRRTFILPGLLKNQDRPIAHPNGAVHTAGAVCSFRGFLRNLVGVSGGRWPGNSSLEVFGGGEAVCAAFVRTCSQRCTSSSFEFTSRESGSLPSLDGSRFFGVRIRSFLLPVFAMP